MEMPLPITSLTEYDLLLQATDDDLEEEVGHVG
jgi:hypothetical protein